MSQLLFQLGVTPELSIREIERSFATTTTTVLPDVLVSLDDASLPTPAEMMQILGGTVKIATVITSIPKDSETPLETAIANHLCETSSGKVHFALAELGRNHLPALNPNEIKKIIQETGATARFVESSRTGLSAAVLIHQKKVREIMVIYAQDMHILAETVATQDIDNWTIRDRSKPYADRKKGMLPPKLARTMVNLCLGNTWSDDSVLLDPFCGSGTVLMEAMMRSVPVIGSDLDPNAVTGATANLTWLSQHYELSVPFNVISSDAANVKPGAVITHLVTEPFLGKPKPNLAQLPNMFKGLEKQYLGAFKHWRTFLADQASLVVVFPQVIVEGKANTVFNLNALIDKLATLGYTTHSDPTIYGRPQAIVQRQLYQFTYTAK